MKFALIILFVLCGCTTNQPLNNNEMSSQDASHDTTRTPMPTALPAIHLSSCTTIITADADHDGHDVELDCNDYDPDIYPGAYEYCDYKDNDCDGETDEIWKLIWDGVYGQPCSTKGDNDCISYGIWACDMDHDWLVCSAPPLTPSPEHCNGLDDDCDGFTDNGPDWPELGTKCAVVAGPACVHSGTWACDDYGEKPYCTAEDTPATSVCETP